jgi:hypothetical protein
MTRRQQVIDLLRAVGLELDDDEIAERLGMNRHYVNQVCRALAADGIIVRTHGPVGKYVNQFMRDPVTVHPATPTSAPSVPRPKIKRSERARQNVDALIARFAECIDGFESSSAFPGPSLYFHERALACRRRHSSAAALLADDMLAPV